MAVEGIWTGEIYSVFGWESSGVFVLEGGRVIGGDHRQYTMGSYSLSGDRFKAELTVHYYGPPRTVYGDTAEQFTTIIDGTLKNGTIEGMIGRPDRPEYDLQVRLTRRMDLPA